MPVGSTSQRSVQELGFASNCQLTPPCRLYPLPVRQASALPTASSRFRLATDTLAVQLTLPLAGCAEDLHLQVSAPCRAHNSNAPPNGEALTSTAASSCYGCGLCSKLITGALLGFYPSQTGQRSIDKLQPHRAVYVLPPYLANNVSICGCASCTVSFPSHHIRLRWHRLGDTAGF
jgi:hypothetical protein